MFKGTSGIPPLLLFVWISWAAFSDARQVFLNDSMPSLVASPTFNKTGSKKPISFLAAISYGGYTIPMGPICTEAMRIALEKINENTDLLLDYELVAEPIDTQCSQSVGVKAVMLAISGSDKVNNRLPIITGPLCSGHHYTGQLLEHVNFIGILLSSSTLRPYKQRNLYRNFLLMLPPILEEAFRALRHFILQSGWRKIGIIQENSQFFSQASATFISESEKNGIELLGLGSIPYLSGQMSESVHIKMAVEEIRQSDAKIIVVNSVLASRVACWMHRYRLYGPNYVIFVLAPFGFQSNDRFRIRPWCTKDMLNEVLGSVVLFGPTDSMNLGMMNQKDSLGCTGTEFENNLRTTIPNVQRSRTWWGQRSYCYDSTMSVAFTLNATEMLLQKRNETLSDWTTTSEKYRKNGKVINDIMKQGFAMSAFRFKSGSVVINKTTLMPKGQSNIGFFQYRVMAGNKAVVLPVAKYDVRNNSAQFGPYDIKWNTPNGSPPSDHVQTIYKRIPLIGYEGYIAIIVIAGVQLAMIVVVWFYQTCNCMKKERISNSVPVLNSLILFGDGLLEIGILLQIHEKHALHCMLTLGLLLLGIFFLLYGMLAKLEMAALIFFVHENPSPTDRYSTSRPWQEYLLSFGYRAVIAFFVMIAILIAVFFMSLMIAWFANDPLLFQQSLSSISISDQDNSIAFQDVIYTCQFGTANITKIALGIIAGVCVLMALRAAFLAHVLRSVKNDFVGIVDLPEVINSFYCTLTLLLCGGVIGGLIFADDPLKAEIALDVMVLTSVATNLIILFFAKVFKDDAIPDSSEMEMTEGTTLQISRQGAAAISRFQAGNI